MASIDVGPIDKIVVDRDVHGREDRRSTHLVITSEDGTTFTFDHGDTFVAVEELHSTLEQATAAVKAMLDDWEDDPDEFDAFLGRGHGRGRYSWYAVLGPGMKDAKRVEGIPTEEMAAYELARLMVEAGEFPNVWRSGDDVPFETPYHEQMAWCWNEGGDGLADLPGRQYEAGDDVLHDGWGWTVKGDYGEHGVWLVIHGDPDVQTVVAHDQRDQITRITDDGSENA